MSNKELEIITIPVKRSLKRNIYNMRLRTGNAPPNPFLNQLWYNADINATFIWRNVWIRNMWIKVGDGDLRWTKTKLNKLTY